MLAWRADREFWTSWATDDDASLRAKFSEAVIAREIKKGGKELEVLVDELETETSNLQNMMGARKP